MLLSQLKNIKTKDEARQEAINYQYRISRQNLSYGETILWQSEFVKLAKKFGLVKEFKDNGII